MRSQRETGSKMAEEVYAMTMLFDEPKPKQKMVSKLDLSRLSVADISGYQSDSV